MNYRTTLLLLIVVGLLGAGLWMMQRSTDPAAERFAQTGRLLDGDLMNVEALTILNSDYEMDLVRRGDDWWIVSPVEARASEAGIGHLLSASESLVCEETITREQREHRGLSLGDYGLDVPRTAVLYRTPLGARRLLIGHDARLGKRMYVRFDGEPSVLLVDASLRQALPDSIESMRDRALLHGQVVRVMRLEIERPGGGFVQLLRSEAGWVVQQPVREPAAGAVVTSLLDSLYTARIERFIWDPPTGSERVTPGAPAAPVESYGLAADTAPARVRLWEAGDDIGRELAFGKVADAAAGTVYASFTDGGAIFTLAAALLKRFELPVDDLRDRALVRMDPRDLRYLAVKQGDLKLTLGRTDASGWSILEPIQWRADAQTVADVLRRLTEARVESFVDASATNAPALVDEGAVLRVTLDTLYPPAAGTVGAPETGEGVKSNEGTTAGRCELVATSSADAGLLLVQCSRRPGRVLVRREALAFLSAASAMPLSFFDRSVLAVSPEHVRRIRVQRGDVVQTLERDAEGRWRALQPEGGLVDATALTDVLFRVSNLRAERVESQNPPSLAPYGLDAPQTSLTLGLTGGEAIQKIILVGASAGASGRFAMVQGQAVIFVLDPATVESLLRGVVLLEANES